MWIEREHLEDECDVALARWLHAHLLAVNIDLPARRQLKTGHHAQCRRLAAA